MTEVTEKEILEARKKLAEKFGNTQIGGKGTQRRKHEVKKRTNKVESDKKIESIAKKSQAKKLNEINEINIFKDDNTVIHFKKPTLEYSFKEKVSFVSGLHETKNIKELLPAIIKQLGPKQFEFMKEYAETLKSKDKKDDKNDQAPELDEDFESVSKKDDKKKKEKKKKNAKKQEEKKDEEKKDEEKKNEENEEKKTNEENKEDKKNDGN